MRWMILLLLTGLILPAVAQDDDEPPRAPVQVESAFIRAAPALDATAIGSIFLDDSLEIVGRSADGTWFEVRRPGREDNLGWIFNEMLDWDFQPELLPLTDSKTGMEGPEPLDPDGLAVFILENVSMRTDPQFRAGRIMVVPHSVTVQTLERNQDASWLKINYLGHIGWVVGFIARYDFDYTTIPLAENLPPMPTRVIVPPEIQLAQVQRLRDYVTASKSVADQLAAFWWQVSLGEVMPCNAPPFVQAYLYSDRDVQQLPELDRLVPRLDTAIEHLNESIEPLTLCGVMDIDVVREARADAINASIIFEANLGQLDILEDIIR